MIKTGIVISIMNKKTGIMTSDGEFVYIKTNKSLINTGKVRIGEIHTGELYKKNIFVYKYVLAAASLMFICLSSGYAHFYYTPVTTIVLSINPSVSLQANRWNKIINCKSLNSDGSLILNNVKLKNKSIDDSLEILVKEAQTENFINDKYVADKKIISLNFKSTKNNSIDITNFKKIIDTSKLNVKISALAINNKTIDITVNNKKITTSNLNSISHNQEHINKQAIKKSNPIKKASIDIHANIIKDKSSKTKEEYIKKSNPTINKDNKVNYDNKFENKNLNKNNINSSTNEKSDVSNDTKKNMLDNKNMENTKMSNKESSFKNSFDKFFRNSND